MIDYKTLALDESGKASFNHQSKNFVLSGLILPERYKTKLAKQIVKLKKKFFEDENIVLHTRDILRKKGPFSILRNNAKKELQFWAELISIINSSYLSIAFVITDKSKAKILGWNDIAILRRAYNKMLEKFVVGHLGASKGKIIQESDPYQDKYLIEAHNKLQTLGVPSEGITGPDYRKKVTCLSLVNKLNLDVDVQLSDSLAIMADLVYRMKIGNIKKTTKVEAMMIRLISRKMKDKKNPGIFEILV